MSTNPARTPAESRMAFEGQQNAGGAQRRADEGRIYYDPAPLTEYPKMLYRKTNVKQYQEWADTLHPGSEEKFVTNSFDGLLCETIRVENADEAEEKAAQGWDISARAAHGMVKGMAAVTTAKDDEIAELRRQLAEAKRNIGLPADPDDPEDFDVTESELAAALTEREERQRNASEPNETPVRRRGRPPKAESLDAIE